MKILKKGDYLDLLLRSPKTVFSVPEIVMLWQDSNINAVLVRLNSYVAQKKLIRLRRGIYVKDKRYNPLELGTKILTPAYISFETVLANTGVIFQHYSQIFVASYAKREIVCDTNKYQFCSLKQETLVDPTGIVFGGNFSIATPERALLDTLYRSKNYYFDNLDQINRDKIYEILPIYKNKRMKRVVDSLLKI